MKDGSFGGFEVVQNTDDQETEIRIVIRNGLSEAIVFEHGGLPSISMQSKEDLLFVRGTFLAVIEILNKHINA